jgi:hypothetical protein
MKYCPERPRRDATPMEPKNVDAAIRMAAMRAKFERLFLAGSAISRAAVG